MKVQIMPDMLTGKIAAPPSKSHLHRLLLAAAFSDGATRIYGAGEPGADIAATCACLNALGVFVQFENGVCTVTPATLQKGGTLHANESGTTLRLLLPVAAALGADVTFVGNGRLPARPIQPLLHALRAGGVEIAAAALPLQLNGKLKPGRYVIPGNISSQFVSGLLFGLSLLNGESELCVTERLESLGYVHLTLAVLRGFGVCIEETAAGYRVFGTGRFRTPGTVQAEGDWSNAAVFLAAGALGKPVTVTGLNPRSAQGDKEILAVLERMGASVVWENGAVTVAKNECRAFTVDISDIPDLAPVLAALAACAEGESILKNAERLKEKESDRIVGISRVLRDFGIRSSYNGSLHIHGSVLSSATTDGGNDHRLVMLAALLGTLDKGCDIIGAEAVHKSYPAFLGDITKLGGRAYVLEG